MVTSHLSIKQKFDIKSGIGLGVLALMGVFILALGFEVIELGQEKSKIGFSIIGITFIVVALAGCYYRFGRSLSIERENLVSKRIIGSTKYNINNIKEVRKMYTLPMYGSSPINNETEIQIVTNDSDKVNRLLVFTFKSKEDLRRLNEFLNMIKKINPNIQIRTMFYNMYKQTCEIKGSKVYLVNKKKAKNNIVKEELVEQDYEPVKDEYSWFFEG